MAFPTNLDTTSTIPVESSSTPLSTNHVTNHTASQTAIIALENKVGVDGSAVTSTHDYKLSGVTGTDKAVSKTGTETLTNKTLTSPTVTSATITTSTVNGVTLQTAGAATDFLAANGTYVAGSVTNASTTAKGIVELATSAEITAGTATGGTGAALVVTPDALLASRPVTDVQAFTTAATTSWTKPTNAKWVEVTVIGGGGAGGSGSAGNNSSGGGGGSYGFKRFAASALGSTETVVVGAAGVAGANNTAGGDGGFSSFGTTTLIKANGGSGGLGSGVAAAGGAIGNGDIVYAGGASSFNGSATPDTANSPSPRGGGSGGYSGGTPTLAINGSNGGSFITNYVKAGGAGGAAGVNNGTAATSTTAGLIYGGVGGGGGGFNGSGTGTGGNGGAGGFPGGGGGGSVGTNNVGGNGANGMVYVVTYF